MTETTDKLTLQQLKDVRELCLPHTAWRSIIDELISARDQLEAERQRADAAESYARERDSENESIALTVGRLRLELAKLRGKLDTPIVTPPRKTAKDYVDDEFYNADLAAIYNAARLELKARIKNAGFTVKDG